MIRPAREADIPALAEMGRRFHALSPWAGVEYAPEAAAASLAAMLGSESFAVLVSEDGAAVRGAIGVMIAPVYFAAGAVLAQEAFWWCESPRDALGLLKAAEYWSRRKGAARLIMLRLEGVRDDTMDRLYRRLGYAPVEHHYAKAP